MTRITVFFNDKGDREKKITGSVKVVTKALLGLLNDDGYPVRDWVDEIIPSRFPKFEPKLRKGRFF